MFSNFLYLKIILKWIKPMWQMLLFVHLGWWKYFSRLWSFLDLKSVGLFLVFFVIVCLFVLKHRNPPPCPAHGCMDGGCAGLFFFFPVFPDFFFFFFFRLLYWTQLASVSSSSCIISDDLITPSSPPTCFPGAPPLSLGTGFLQASNLAGFGLYLHL